MPRPLTLWSRQANCGPKTPLDYETKSSYSVTVSVSDSKDAGGNADTAADDTITVTITVSNVEEPPEFPDWRVRGSQRGRGHGGG